jgi:hypothetical protein
MRFTVRIARVVALLLLAIVVPLAVASAGGRFIGNRVYMLNSTHCRVVVMEEHDGYGANPGETILVKPGLVDRTPTMLILAGSTVWFGGLHFTDDMLQVRGQADIVIPRSWLHSSFLGSTLTYELTAGGELLVKQPPDQSSVSQPQGFPLKARPPSASSECAHG